MGYSAATSTPTASPRAAQASRSAVIMRDSRPWRRWVADTVTWVSAAALTVASPGHGQAWCRSCAACRRCASPSTAAQTWSRSKWRCGTRPRRESAPAAYRKPVRMASTQAATSSGSMVRTSTDMAPRLGESRRRRRTPNFRVRTGPRGPRSRPCRWRWPRCRSGC